MYLYIQYYWSKFIINDNTDEYNSSLIYTNRKIQKKINIYFLVSSFVYVPSYKNLSVDAFITIYNGRLNVINNNNLQLHL